MARPLRIEFPGALYHVTSRGNERGTIFRSDHDRRTCLAFLGQAATRFTGSLSLCLPVQLEAGALARTSAK
jgi:hypothetical protein